MWSALIKVIPQKFKSQFQSQKFKILKQAMGSDRDRDRDQQQRPAAHPDQRAGTTGDVNTQISEHVTTT